jgi:putative ABC transport system permease protein
LINLYNIVYFELSNDNDLNTASNYLKSFVSYQNLSIDYTYNVNAIYHMINRNTAAFRVILVTVIVAIIIVMQTTLMLYFNDKTRSFSIVNILGGKSSFNISILSIEFFIFFIISLISSIFISNFVINYGFEYVGLDFYFQVSFFHILLGIISFIGLFVLVVIYSYSKLKNQSTVIKIREEIHIEKLSYIYLLLLSLISFSAFLIFRNNAVSSISAIVSIFSSLIFLFSFSFLLIKLLPSLFVKLNLKHPFFYHLKIVTSKKAFIQYLSVLLISFLSIYLTVFSNHHMNYRIQIQENEYNIDFVLTNFISRYDDTFNDLDNVDNIASKDKVLLFNNIEILNDELNIELVVSIDPTKIYDYFNLDIDQESITLLSDTNQKVIILPSRYNLLDGYNVNDKIMVNINPTYDEVEFIVGGFFEKYVSNLAFVNLDQFSEFDSSSQKAIFINQVEESSSLKQTLIERYSENLIYVIDFNQVVKDDINEIKNATSYLTYIFSAIIMCFVLAIFNHSLLLFDQMQKNYARVYVIGSSRKGLAFMLIFESLLIYLIVFVASSISFYMLSSQMTNIIKLTNEYEYIVLQLKTFVVGSLITLFIHLFSKIVYLFKLVNLNPSIVLKNYE